jgi:hypothetical protein
MHGEHSVKGHNKFVSNIYMLTIHYYLPHFFLCYTASEVKISSLNTLTITQPIL